MLRYPALLLMSFLGLHIGTIMAHFTKEELKPGQNYFLILKHLLFSAVMMYFFIYLGIGIWWSIVAAALFFAMSYKLMALSKHDFVFYTIFSIVLFETREFTPVVSIMIFFFGVVVAALNFEGLSRTMKKLTLSNISFLVFGILLSL